MGRSKKEEKKENIKADLIPETEQISSQTNNTNTSKPKSKKTLIIIIILFIIGILVVTGILVVPKVLEMIEDNSEDEESNKITETIEVKVIPSYNESAYVIEGIPDTVKIEITGKKKAVAKAKENSNDEIKLDLSKYQSSKEKIKVKLEYNCPEKVECEIKPSSINVSILDKTSDAKSISYDLMNQDKLDPKLSVKSVVLSKSDVVVRGSQETIDSISSIKALIDLSNEEFTKAGTYTVDSLKIVAYDNNGKIVDNVEISATNISARIELDSFSKNVPVKVQIIGELAGGKAISSITINGIEATSFTTTIYGDKALLEKIDSIPIVIDVDEQGNNGSITYKVTISKPSGVRSISDESVTIVLNFGEAKQKTIVIKDIRAINVSNGLIANLASKDDYEVEVQVIGVESVLNQLDKNNSGIYAYVDLTGLSSGPYSIPVKVEGNDSRLQYIVTKNINVILNEQ